MQAGMIFELIAIITVAYLHKYILLSVVCGVPMVELTPLPIELHNSS